MVRIAVTCTAPRCHDYVADLRACGLDAYAAPALTVTPLDTPAPVGGDTPFDAALVTSAHAARLAPIPRHLPCIAVGGQTAAILKERGYRVVTTGNGGIAALDLSPYGRLLYPCGAGSTDVPANTSPWPVYAANPHPDFAIDPDTRLIILFSARGADVFTATETGVTPDVICLSDAVADRIRGRGHADLAVCPHPAYDEVKKLVLTMAGDGPNT